MQVSSLTSESEPLNSSNSADVGIGTSTTACSQFNELVDFTSSSGPSGAQQLSMSGECVDPQSDPEPLPILNWSKPNQPRDVSCYP
jgi:hypothetical protein